MKSTLNGKILCEYLSPLYKSISYPVVQDKPKEIWEWWRTRQKIGRVCVLGWVGEGGKERLLKENEGTELSC